MNTALQQFREWLEYHKDLKKFHSDRMLYSEIIAKLDELESAEDLKESYSRGQEELECTCIPGAITICSNCTGKFPKIQNSPPGEFPEIPNFTAMRYPTERPGVTTSDTLHMQLEALTQFCQSVRNLLLKK